MWRPGFEFIEKVPARLIRRATARCASTRLTIAARRKKPGLVLGHRSRRRLPRQSLSGSRRSSAATTIGYLRSREADDQCLS